MVKKYEKHESEPVSERFLSSDFDCKCAGSECRFTFVDERLAKSLDALWDLVGPIQIDSGFRCDAHNAEIGGVKNSYHCKGLAADCRAAIKPYDLSEFAEEIDAFAKGGIGVYASFVHLDVRNGPARWLKNFKC